MLAPGDEFVERRIGTLHSAAQGPSSRRPLWASRNLVRELS
jgi:hypothetical protein